MKKGLIFLALIGSIANLIGQETTGKSSITSENKVNRVNNKSIVVNLKMIQRFNDYEPSREYVSLFDVYKSLDGRERVEYLREYRMANLETESLLDIKSKVQLRLAETQFSDEDVNLLCMRKKQMSEALISGSLVFLQY